MNDQTLRWKDDINQSDARRETDMMTASRRDFLGRASTAMSGLALASLMDSTAGAAAARSLGSELPTANAKRVIYLFQSGGPPQHDTFDYKPHLNKVHGQETPASVFNGQRLTGMTAGQSSFPVARSTFKFQQHGRCGAWVSDAMPHLAKVVDNLCFIRSMHTAAINHDPAITFLQTGFQIAGRPSIGAWMSYGLLIIP